MKRVFLIGLLLVIAPLIAFSQSKDISSIFDKYSSKKGFVVVNLNSPASMPGMNKSSKPLKDIGSMKILSLDDDEKASQSDINSFKADLKKINTSGYLEFMSVKESGSSVKMLYKKSGEKIVEFLMIVVGDDDSTLIWMSGSMTLDDLGKLGKFKGSFGGDDE